MYPLDIYRYTAVYCRGAMDAHFAKFFRQQLHSDADIILQLRRSFFDRPEELTKFPGHLVVLDQSPYFFAQRDFRGQQQQQQVANPSRSRSRSPVRTRSTVRASSTTIPLSGRNPRDINSTEDDSGRQSARASVVLTLENNAHETAAVAVIGSMYGVRSAIGDLQQAELVYAVQLGDMLGIESATTQAVQLLREAAAARSGLLPETIDTLALMPSWPSCLLPLVPDLASTVGAEGLDPSGLLHSITPKNCSIRKVLVSSLGNLEQVWQQPDLRGILLSIPLKAMQLLLSADELIVHSEDTVLYTAKKYIAAQHSTRRQVAAREGLSSIVRVPHLSAFQLQINQQSHESCLLLEPYKDLLQRLSHIQRISPTAEELRSEVQQMGPRVPSSWLQGSRRVVAMPLGGIKMTWQLPVAQLKETSNSTHRISSPFSSPPFAGVDWKVFWDFRRDTNGMLLGLYASFSSPPGVYSRVLCQVDVKAATHQSWSKTIHNIMGRGEGPPGLGWPDFLGVGRVKDSDDWVAKGLPTNGDLEIILTVYKME